MSSKKFKIKKVFHLTSNDLFSQANNLKMGEHLLIIIFKKNLHFI